MIFSNQSFHFFTANPYPQVVNIERKFNPFQRGASLWNGLNMDIKSQPSPKKVQEELIKSYID